MIKIKIIITLTPANQDRIFGEVLEVQLPVSKSLSFLLVPDKTKAFY